MTTVPLGPITWERILRAVEKVRARLDRAVAALDAAGIPYAVAGGNAVAAWVSRVDEAAVRNTQDVDILLRREDLERAKIALATVGFVFRHVKSIDMFLDGADAKARDAIHVVFAREKVQADSVAQAPDVLRENPGADVRTGAGIKNLIAADAIRPQLAQPTAVDHRRR